MSKVLATPKFGLHADDARLASSSALMLSAGLVSRSEMMCAFAHTKSQLHEDLRLLHAILLAGKRGPPDRQNTFVELGALNGVYLSNTYMLQKCFGWRGVLIEANPTSFAALSGSSGRCDTAKFTKPSTAKCVHAAVCPGNGRAPDGTKTVVNFAAGGSIPEVTADVDPLLVGLSYLLLAQAAVDLPVGADGQG